MSQENNPKPGKYIIFAGSTYYPSGGFLDYYDSADTEEEAQIIKKEALEIGSKNLNSWNGSYQELCESYEYDIENQIERLTDDVNEEENDSEENNSEESDSEENNSEENDSEETILPEYKEKETNEKEQVIESFGPCNWAHILRVEDLKIIN
jgi:hypothetical protein